MIDSNSYFEDTVKSLGYSSAEGKSTVGVMEPGDYEFGTSSHETMIVIEGELQVTFAGTTDVVSFRNGEQFEVEANSSFKVKSVGQTSYLCKYK